MVDELTTEVVSLSTFNDGEAYQLNWTLVLATKLIPTFDPLQMVSVSGFKMSTGGFTVTTKGWAKPGHEP